MSTPVLQLTNIGTNNVAGNWNIVQGQRQSVIYSANPSFPRVVVLDSSAVTVSRPGVQPVQMTLATFMSAVATVAPNLTYPPIDVQDPSNTIVCNLGPASFVSAFSAETSISYYWQSSVNGGSNWTNVSGGVYSNQTTNTLNISNSNTLNGTLYRCVAFNPAGTTNSNGALLTGVPDPTITVQPSSQTVAAPLAATFQLKAIGLSALSYVWQFGNGTNVTANAIYSGVTTNSLYINTVTGLNGSNYKCFVSDSNGNTTSSNVVLTVQ